MKNLKQYIEELSKLKPIKDIVEDLGYSYDEDSKKNNLTKIDKKYDIIGFWVSDNENKVSFYAKLLPSKQSINFVNDSYDSNTDKGFEKRYKQIQMKKEFKKALDKYNYEYRDDLF